MTRTPKNFRVCMTRIASAMSRAILQFRKDLRLEHVLILDAVRLRGTDRRSMRGGPAGQHADAGVLPRFSDRVPGLEALDLATEVCRHLGAEVIRQRQQDLRSEPLQQGSP